MRRSDIEVALRGRTLSLWGSWRELRRIKIHLHPDELVNDVVAGNFGKTGGRSLVVATSERILIVKDGWIFKNSQGISYGSLKSVEIETGIFFSTISFIAEGIEINTTKVGRWSGRKFVDLVRGRIGSRYASWQANQTGQVIVPPVVPTPAPAPFNPLDFNNPNSVSTPVDNSVLSQLERLSSLRDKGVLSEVEFQTAKSRLLHEY